MLSHLEANGVLHVRTAQVGDLMDIDRRIKNGDESGWRGDPSMCVCINTTNGMFEVWGIDRCGHQYKAASHHKLDVELVRKLRDGDPRTHDVFSEVMAANARAQQLRDDAEHDARMVIADKLAWAVRRDFAAQLGTGRHDVIPVPRKVGAE